MGENKGLQIIDPASFNVKLKKVRFDRLEIKDDLSDDTDFDLKTKDDYKIMKVTDNKVELEFKREKYFEPAGLFKIEIVFGVDYYFQSPGKAAAKKEEEIKDEIEKEYRGLFAPAAATASLIVSSLTSVDWRIPIIDPPYPLPRKE